MAKKQYWFTQEILFLTEHFGKKYFYMKDVDGHIYGVRANPVYGTSTDAEGNSIRFVKTYEPDLT